jgi:O-antigen/teichoic acid export membrane protein
MLEGPTLTAAGRMDARRTEAVPPAEAAPGQASGARDHRAGRFLTLMGGRFTRDTSIYVAGMLAVGPFSLISVAVLTRLMLPAAYGELALLMVFASYLTMLYNTGSLHGTFMWVYGASEGEGDEVDSDTTITSTPRRALGTGVVLTLMIVTAGTAVCWAIAPVVAQLLLLHGHGAMLVRWAAASAAAGSLWRLTVNVLRMERRPGRYAIFNALRPLFVVSGSVPLVALGFGIEGALVGTALGTLVATAAAMAMSWRSYAFAFNWGDARQILRRGSMVVVPVLALFVVHSADVVLLSHFAPAKAVGVYRVASRFAAVPSYFASAFLLAWSPLEKSVLFQATYRHVGEARVRGAILTYYMLAAMTIVVLLDVTGDGLVLLAGPAYRSAAPLIPLIGVAFVCYGLFIVLARALKVERRRMLLYGTAAVVALVVEIAVSIFTIPRLGAYGVPVAMIVGLLTSCLLWVVAARWLVSTPLEFQLRPLAGLAGAVALAALVQAVGLTLWPAGRPLVLALTLASYLVALVQFGALPRRHIRPLGRLVRAAVRQRIGSRDPMLGLSRLDAPERGLLVAIERDKVPTAVLAERLGRPAEQLRGEYTAILRKLIGAGTATPELDERLGGYLLSREPEAQRDRMAHEVIEDGVDSFELMELNETVQKLRALPPQTWTELSAAVRTSRGAVHGHGHRVRLRTLIEHLAELPEPHRRAAVSALRDGLTPAQIAAETGLSEQLVAARVVRVMRNVANLGRGGPHDATIGMALLGSPPDTSRPPEARGVGLVYDQIRAHRRRRWRRAGVTALTRTPDPGIAARGGVQ